MASKCLNAAVWTSAAHLPRHMLGHYPSSWPYSGPQSFSWQLCQALSCVVCACAPCRCATPPWESSSASRAWRNSLPLWVQSTCSFWVPVCPFTFPPHLFLKYYLYSYLSNLFIFSTGGKIYFLHCWITSILQLEEALNKYFKVNEWPLQFSLTWGYKKTF